MNKYVLKYYMSNNCTYCDAKYVGIIANSKNEINDNILEKWQKWRESEASSEQNIFGHIIDLNDLFCEYKIDFEIYDLDELFEELLP